MPMQLQNMQNMNKLWIIGIMMVLLCFNANANLKDYFEGTGASGSSIDIGKNAVTDFSQGTEINIANGTYGLYTISLACWKQGTPTFNFSVELYNGTPTGLTNIKANATNWYNSSGLGSSLTWINFTFDNKSLDADNNNFASKPSTSI